MGSTLKEMRVDIRVEVKSGHVVETEVRILEVVRGGEEEVITNRNSN